MLLAFSMAESFNPAPACPNAKYPVLKADAIKFVSSFRLQIPKDRYPQLHRMQRAPIFVQFSRPERAFVLVFLASKRQSKDPAEIAIDQAQPQNFGMCRKLAKVSVKKVQSQVILAILWFSNHALLQPLQLLANWVKSPNPVVHSYSATAIDHLLTARDEHGQLRLTKAEWKDLAGVLE